MGLSKWRVLNANTIKFLACALMVVDHIGVLFFPREQIWRAIGRLSMPLFAFAIAEGCRYTRNKCKHLLLPFLLALVCQIVYYFFDNGSLYMCILVTFSLSIVTIYALQNFKTALFTTDDTSDKVLSGVLFALTVFCVYALNQVLTIDYGFWGCMTPVFASLCDFHGLPAPAVLKKLDNVPVRALCMAVPLCLIPAFGGFGKISYFALLAIPLLFLYNEKKGRLKTKYFFYLFYPLHLVLLEAIVLFL